MKKIIFVVLLMVGVVLSGCARIPREFKDHPCAETCYPSGSVDPRFEEVLKKIEKPVCRNWVEIDVTFDKKISPFCTDSMIGPMLPPCGECDTFCDCELKDGTFMSEYLLQLFP